MAVQSPLTNVPRIKQTQNINEQAHQHKIVLQSMHNGKRNSVYDLGRQIKYRLWEQFYPLNIKNSKSHLEYISNSLF